MWKELPEDWLQGLNIKRQVASSIYDENVNKYGKKCGGSLEMWEESGWIVRQDTYGWFQWYCRSVAAGSISTAISKCCLVSDGLFQWYGLTRGPVVLVSDDWF